MVKKQEMPPRKNDMVMQVKFFEGTSTEVVEDKFNAWSNGSQWISHSSLSFRGPKDETILMKVIYGVKADEYLSDHTRSKVRAERRGMA